METISDRLAQVRAHTGLGTREFGARVGVSHSTVSNYESGHSEKVPGEYLAEVCRVYETDPRWLLLGEGEMKRTDPDQAAKDLAEIRRILREGS